MSEKRFNQPSEHLPPSGDDFVIPDFVDVPRHELYAAARQVGNTAELERLQEEADDWSSQSGPSGGRRVLIDVVNGPDEPSAASTAKSRWAPPSPDSGFADRHAAATAERARLARDKIKAQKVKAAESDIISAYEKQLNTSPEDEA